MSLYALRDLRQVYGQRTVLDIPRLDVIEGTVCALLGPNGSGKTTLLKILALLEPPTHGLVSYLGKRVDFAARDLHLLRRQIVMVAQNPVLFTTTVYKNLDFGLKIRNVPKPERGRRIGEALDLVGMGDFAQADATALSSGESQRVAIARALVCSPRVMLLDEPTSNVDAENQAAIERILEEINRFKGISVLFATHDLDQAARVSKEVVSLFEGRWVRFRFQNILRGHVVMDEQQGTRCILQNGTSLRVETERRGYVRLAVDPERVILLPGQGGPSENVISGRVTQLTVDGNRVRVRVDAGSPLVFLAEGPQAEVLRMGQMIGVHVPPEALSVL